MTVSMEERLADAEQAACDWKQNASYYKALCAAGIVFFVCPHCGENSGDWAYPTAWRIWRCWVCGGRVYRQPQLAQPGDA